MDAQISGWSPQFLFSKMIFWKSQFCLQSSRLKRHTFCEAYLNWDLGYSLHLVARSGCVAPLDVFDLIVTSVSKLFNRFHQKSVNHWVHTAGWHANSSAGGWMTPGVASLAGECRPLHIGHFPWVCWMSFLGTVKYMLSAPSTVFPRSVFGEEARDVHFLPRGQHFEILSFYFIPAVHTVPLTLYFVQCCSRDPLKLNLLEDSHYHSRPVQDALPGFIFILEIWIMETKLRGIGSWLFYTHVQAGGGSTGQGYVSLQAFPFSFHIITSQNQSHAA